MIWKLCAIDTFHYNAFFPILFVISYQEDVIDIMVNALEKFAWASTEIATHMKVGNILVT